MWRRSSVGERRRGADGVKAGQGEHAEREVWSLVVLPPDDPRQRGRQRGDGAEAASGVEVRERTVASGATERTARLKVILIKLETKTEEEDAQVYDEAQTERCCPLEAKMKLRHIKDQ